MISLYMLSVPTSLLACRCTIHSAVISRMHSGGSAATSQYIQKYRFLAVNNSTMYVSCSLFSLQGFLPNFTYLVVHNQPMRSESTARNTPAIELHVLQIREGWALPPSTLQRAAQKQ